VKVSENVIVRYSACDFLLAFNDNRGPMSYRFRGKRRLKVKVKEVDLYSAFIEVPYTEGAQVRITQCYLQTTQYLPLPRKHSPDGASQTEVADI